MTSKFQWICGKKDNLGHAAHLSSRSSPYLPQSPQQQNGTDNVISLHLQFSLTNIS